MRGRPQRATSSIRPNGLRDTETILSITSCGMVLTISVAMKPEAMADRDALGGGLRASTLEARCQLRRIVVWRIAPTAR